MHDLHHHPSGDQRGSLQHHGCEDGGPTNACDLPYQNSRGCGIEYQYSSISFPLISSGIYGYPKAETLEVAINTISKFLLEHDLDVYIVIFDKKAVQFSKKLFSDIKH